MQKSRCVALRGLTESGPRPLTSYSHRVGLLPQGLGMSLSCNTGLWLALCQCQPCIYFTTGLLCLCNLQDKQPGVEFDMVGDDASLRICV